MKSHDSNINAANNRRLSYSNIRNLAFGKKAEIFIFVELMKETSWM
jgi:hypothetical protein